MSERRAREFEWSEKNSRNFLQVLRATRENSREILRGENSPKKSALVRIQGKEHSSAYHAPVIDMGLSQLPLMLTLLRSLRLPSTAMSPVQICVIHQTKFLSEHESSNGAGEISRKFLQVLRATRENSSKILRGEISSKKALVRNLRKEHSSKQHLPSRE